MAERTPELGASNGGFSVNMCKNISLVSKNAISRTSLSVDFQVKATMSKRVIAIYSTRET